MRYTVFQSSPKNELNTVLVNSLEHAEKIIRELAEQTLSRELNVQEEKELNNYTLFLENGYCYYVIQSEFLFQEPKQHKKLIEKIISRVKKYLTN